MNSELVNISDWLISNKLTLNVSKSNFIIIHPPQRKRNKQVTIKINGENLEEKSHTKYLGVLIDKNLNWKAHIHHINLKLAKGLGMIAKIRHFIPSSVLRNIYYDFIHAHINYAILNWGSAAPTNLEPIKVSMRKAVRLMTFQDRDAHSEPLFQQFNILNFDDSYRLEVAKFMHDISHNKLQQSFQTMFSLVKERHSRVTRQTTDNKFSLPLVQTNYGKRFITFFGVKTWNNILKDIRSLDSKHTFSTKYFAHLHSQYKKV